MKSKPFKPHALQESTEKLTQQKRRIEKTISQTANTPQKGFLARLYGRVFGG
jgi:hypothetical protein